MYRGHLSLSHGGRSLSNWSWWRHQMKTFSALLAICAGNSPGTGEFPTQRPVTRSFDVFFDLHLNKRLSKQSWGWWFQTPSHPLWRHCNLENGLQWKFIKHSYSDQIFGYVFYGVECPCYFLLKDHHGFSKEHQCFYACQYETCPQSSVAACRCIFGVVSGKWSPHKSNVQSKF